MASNWQLWLSARPTKRTNTANDASVFTAEDAILYEFIARQPEGVRAVRETHFLAKKSVREGKSGPPLHIHLRQKETFSVKQGVLGVVKNGKEYAITSADGTISIPPGTRHTFWAHASTTEDLIFDVWVEPQDLDHGFDEHFMRNFSSYLKDCERAQIAPSLFQTLLFLYNADIVLTPPFWVPIWLLMGLHHVLAYWVGAGLLGYKTSYPEYSNATPAQSKKSD